MLKYYWTYLSYIVRFKQLKWAAKSFLAETKRDVEKHLQWEAIYKARDTKNPVAAYMDNYIFMAFPCGCEEEWYYNSGEVYRDACRCYSKIHRKKYFPCIG